MKVQEGRVLVVDDDADTRANLRDILEMDDYAVAEAGTAAEVLRQVLEELSIGVETCPDVNRAAMRMAQQRFDVAILDCDAHAEVAALLRETRVSRINDSTLAVAIVPSQESIR